MAPTTPSAELQQIEARFINAIKSQNWQEASELLDHADAWSFANQIIFDKFGKAQTPVTALEVALWSGQKDLAKKLIAVTGAYCGSKNELIEGLESDLKNKQKSIAKLHKNHAEFESGIDPKKPTEGIKEWPEKLEKMIIEDKKDLQEGTELLELIKKANAICY
jgi:wobble nucleotide-excising tRNase